MVWKLFIRTSSSLCDPLGSVFADVGVFSIVIIMLTIITKLVMINIISIIMIIILIMMTIQLLLLIIIMIIIIMIITMITILSMPFTLSRSRSHEMCVAKVGRPPFLPVSVK